MCVLPTSLLSLYLPYVCATCFCLSVPSMYLVPFSVCGICFSVWVCWVCMCLCCVAGVLVSSLGVFVSWCLWGCVLLGCLCVLSVFCIYVLGSRVYVYCLCWLLSVGVCFLGCVWRFVVPWGLCLSLCCLCVVGLYGCVAWFCIARISVFFFVGGRLLLVRCLCVCGGFRGVGVVVFLFLGFGLVLFFCWLLVFCFLFGVFGWVLMVVCFCWLFGWFFCVLGC